MTSYSVYAIITEIFTNSELVIKPTHPIYQLEYAFLDETPGAVMFAMATLVSLSHSRHTALAWEAIRVTFRLCDVLRTREELTEPIETLFYGCNTISNLADRKNS
jgi:hypothetical protein